MVVSCHEKSSNWKNTCGIGETGEMSIHIIYSRINSYIARTRVSCYELLNGKKGCEEINDADIGIQKVEGMWWCIKQCGSWQVSGVAAQPFTYLPFFFLFFVFT